MDIVVWLRSLGLGQYEAVFRQNDIDETVLPNLTADDLKEVGVASLGHRRKLLDAVAALRADANASPATTPDSAATEVSPRDTAERRQVMVMFSDLVGSENAVTVEPVGEFALKGIRRPLAAYNVVAAAS